MSAKLGINPKSSCRISDEDVKIEPKFNPNSVSAYYYSSPKSKPDSTRTLTLNAKQHLKAMGWSFFYIFKPSLTKDKKKELRYRSTSGKIYYSLKTACKAFLDEFPATFDNVGGFDDDDNVVTFGGSVEEISGCVAEKQGRKRKGVAGISCETRKKRKGVAGISSELKKKKVNEGFCDNNEDDDDDDAYVVQFDESGQEKQGKITNFSRNTDDGLSIPLQEGIGEDLFHDIFNFDGCNVEGLCPDIDPNIADFDGFDFDSFLSECDVLDGKLLSNLEEITEAPSYDQEDPNSVESVSYGSMEEAEEERQRPNDIITYSPNSVESVSYGSMEEAEEERQRPNDIITYSPNSVESVSNGSMEETEEERQRSNVSGFFMELK